MSEPPDFEMEALAWKKQFEGITSKLARKRQDPNTFLDDPLWVAFSIILDTCSLFEELTQQRPTKIHLTRSVEMLVEAYKVKCVGKGDTLRDAPQLLGMAVILDAPYFRLE